MQYHGPDPADLANVFVLNNAFIAWQRTRPPEESRERDLPPEIRARFDALNCEQRERLGRTPFLLMSLAEGDDVRWQALFAERQTRDLLFVQDCADFVLRASKSPRARGRVLNAATGEDITINKLARLTIDSAEKKTAA